MVANDIGHDENDLFEFNGDLSVMESDTMHVQDIILSYVGHWNEFPLLGVGIEKYKGSSGKDQQIAREIKINLTKDNYLIDSIVIVENKYYITGKRKGQQNERI
jgi:hypothetical protein